MKDEENFGGLRLQSKELSGCGEGMRSRITCTTLVAKGWPEQPRNAAYVVLPITTFALAKSKILICWTGQSGVVIVVLRDTINSRARMRAYIILHRELQTESTVHDWNDEQGGAAALRR